METERIHNLTEQEHSVQRTCFMQSDKSLSQRYSFDPESEDLFDKFSPSKTMQSGNLGKVGERECSKKPFAIDRDVNIPPKKRKLLHEEFDSCDVSIEQEIGNNEAINVTFTPELENENLQKSTPSPNQRADKEGQIEFNLQSSVNVKVNDSVEWVKLKCFESIVLDGSNSATFFAGGPIQSSAFSIMPNDTKVNQYVAVAASSGFYSNLSYNNAENMNGIIQFWNLGSLHERKTLNERPTMELALCHDSGIITQMKWCPADCYDKCPPTSHIPRLGFLAFSSFDSCVYIYNVPQPDFMPKLKPALPIYFTQPSMKLVPLFGGPCDVTRKAPALCIDWEENGERIVAGYGNGSVCLWKIKIPSFALNIAVRRAEQPYIVQPYLIFEPSGAPIESLSFAPFSNLRWLAVLSMDNYLRIFDLNDATFPVQLWKQVAENSFVWAEAFCGVYSSPALNKPEKGRVSLSAKDFSAESKRSDHVKAETLSFDTSTHVAVSGNKNIHAIADMAGTVTLNYLQNLCKPQKTSYLTYMLLETKIMALDSVDLDVKTSKSKINISGNILSNEITSISDTKSSLCAKINQGSSSASSSGFCSPKYGKTIVIETDQCLVDDVINFQKHPSESLSMNAFKDINNNGNPLNSEEDTNDEKIKCSELSEDLMHDLLMMKISNLSKSSPQIFPFNTSNNSAYCDSKGAKCISDGALIISPEDSDYTGDTIVYPLEPCFCDTSHSSALKCVEPNAQSENLGLAENDFIICDRNDHRTSARALHQSSTPTDYSGDTIIYSLGECDSNKTDANYLKIEKPGANSRSLCNSETENTFQNNLLHKINEDEAVLCGSKTEFLTENGSSLSFAKEKCEYFLTKESLKSNSEYGTVTQSYNSSNENRNFYQLECSISDFHLLHSEYLFDKSEDKPTESNEISKNNKHPQDLPYENLINRFGVILKNNLDKLAVPLTSKTNKIYLGNNPLSVIKTISWDPNEGCQSWMFLGGNSGVCQLVCVPDFKVDTDKKPRPLHREKPRPQRKTRQQAKCVS